MTHLDCERLGGHTRPFEGSGIVTTSDLDLLVYAHLWASILRNIISIICIALLSALHKSSPPAEFSLDFGTHICYILMCGRCARVEMESIMSIVYSIVRSYLSGMPQTFEAQNDNDAENIMQAWADAKRLRRDRPAIGKLTFDWSTDQCDARFTRNGKSVLFMTIMPAADALPMPDGSFVQPIGY
jgi:hypothetical protein